MSLNKDVQDTIIALLAAGAFLKAAAEAAGVSERTVHDWLARGRGTHPSRPSSPKLREFAKAVDRSRAQARATAEARIYREDPKYWLSHAARSRPGSEGWTDPPEADSGASLIDRLEELGADTTSD